jgi:acetylglutamate kinase
VNERTENIGARRLHTILERLLDDVSFAAPEMRGQEVAIDANYVQRAARAHFEERRLVALYPLNQAKSEARGMENFIGKAEVLMEALPYIQRFYGKTFVIKYGGHAMENEELKASFAQDIVLLKYVGINPVVVHGGGPQIDSVLDRDGHHQPLRARHACHRPGNSGYRRNGFGRQSQQGNRHLDQSARRHGRRFERQRRRVSSLAKKDERYRGESSNGEAPEIIDIGMVGEIIGINPLVIESLDQNKFIPVIAPVGAGKEGETYNINADLVAG